MQLWRATWPCTHPMDASPDPRRSEDPGELLREWRRIFPPAAAMQAPLVVLGTLCSGAAAVQVDDGRTAAAFALAAACQVSQAPSENATQQ